VRPAAVRFFERPWLVNLILLGNYRRLGLAALEALGPRIEGKLLQVACVYGELTPNLCAHLAPDASLDVVDILPVQLENLRRKIGGDSRVSLIQSDSSDLPMAGACYDQVLLFFLLHEQPPETRRRTLEEAFRVLKPGGKLVLVDYSKPVAWHPVRFGLLPILGRLEPFAPALWRDGIVGHLPDGIRPRTIEQTPIFQGLYERVVITK
jgi:ubiquinone/menaquinone biosynthesis C-methylase UbiE